MNAELKRLKERKRIYLNLVAKMDEQIAELEKPKPWEPKGGDWCVFVDGKVLEGDSEPLVSLFGMERPTKEQAEQAAVAMRRFNRLLAYRDEFAPGYIFQVGGMNCYIYAKEHTWLAGSTSTNIHPAEVYFPEHVAKTLCAKLNSGEVVL